MFDFKAFAMPKDDKAILALEKRVIKAYTSKDAKENLHLVLCVHVIHAIANKSADRLTNLFNALPNNANKRGIRTWVQQYTSLEYTTDAAGNPKFMGSDKIYGWKGKEHGGYSPGMTNPFYDMPKVKADNEKPFNFDDLIKIALDKAANAKKHGKLNEYDAMEAQAIAIAIGEFRKVAGMRPDDKAAPAYTYPPHGSADTSPIILKEDGAAAGGEVALAN